MADLNRMADLRRDRGQIILLAAFALAVMFVALALVVNSAIFSENLATRGETTAGADALQVRHEMAINVGRSIESANVHNTSTQSDLEDAVEKGLLNVSNQMERQRSIDGILINVTLRTSNSPVFGSRVAQNQSGGSNPHFTDDASASGATDWALVDDVERDATGTNATRAFHINASKDDLADSQGSAFTIRVEEYDTSDASPPSWDMLVWQDGAGSDTVIVRVEKPGGSPAEECETTVTDDYVEIHVTRGVVDDTPCDALGVGPGGENFRFAAGVGDRYNVTYRNGDQMRGNYSFVTTNESFSSSNNLNVGSRTSPYITDAVYNVSVDLTYDVADLRYETRVRVAPGEPDG